LNFLLSFNKKIFLIFSISFFILIFVYMSFFYIKSNPSSEKKIILNTQNADITKPRFSINSQKQKISITANKGNFVTDDKILLENNVIFKSKKFKIYSDNVLFNKKNLVASSKEKSKFISQNALINSAGFDIIENGNILNFTGKTKLILKWLDL